MLNYSCLCYVIVLYLYNYGKHSLLENVPSKSKLLQCIIIVSLNILFSTLLAFPIWLLGHTILTPLLLMYSWLICYLMIPYTRETQQGGIPLPPTSSLHFPSQQFLYLFLSKHSIPVVLSWERIGLYYQISDCTSPGWKPQLEACLLKSLQFHIWKRDWSVLHFPCKPHMCVAAVEGSLSWGFNVKWKCT